MYQKHKTPYGVFFVLLIIIEVLAYLVSGIFNVPNVTLENWEECMYYALTHPFTAWNDKTPAFLEIALIVWLFIVQYYLYYYRNFSDNTHGSAEWLDVDVANRELADKDPKKNRILTQNLQVSLEGPLPNNNMLVIASSGDGKTTAVVEQNLLQFLSTYVMTDVKGDTLRKLGNAFIKAGYTIRCLNFKNPEKSDRYNPFVYIEREDDLLRAVKAIHDSCRPPSQATAADPFWDDAVNLYLQCMFYATWLSARERGAVGTMNDVLRFSNMETQRYTDEETGEEFSKLGDYMDDLAEKYGYDYPPVRDYYKLKKGAPDTVNSVILMVNGMLAICETAEVRRIFSGNDIDIRELGTGIGGDPDKRIFLPLVVPDINSAYNWILSMFYTQMFDILTRLSDDELKRPLPVRVEVWLDEFYAGPKPADTEKLLGVIRSRNICMIPILQSYSQIKALFKDDKWEIIMDNVSVVLYMGSGPLAASTHKFVSEALGKATVDVRADSTQFGQHGHGGVNFSQTGRELMTPDEVKQLPSTDAIVFLKARQPVYDIKAFPFDRPDLQYVAPKWLKKRYDDALSLGGYEHPVYTIYDPIHFHYITIEREQPLKVYTDQKDIKALQESAKKDPNVYSFEVDENELLYLSWGKKEHSQEEIEEMYQDALQHMEERREKLKGLYVLQDVDATVPESGTKDPEELDKSTWNPNVSFQQFLRAHWDELSAPEQEQIYIAMDEGLTEEQLKLLMMRKLSEMQTWIRAFRLENQQRK